MLHKMSTLEQLYRDTGFTTEWVDAAARALKDNTDKEIAMECPYLHWKEYHYLIKYIYDEILAIIPDAH